MLQTSLRDILREELGQTYNVSVGLSQPLPQRGSGRVEVSFGAAPENIAAMTERVMKEIKRLQDEGPSADLTTRAKEGAQADLRNRDQAERLLAPPAGDGAHAGTESGGDSAADRADRCRDARGAPRGVPALLPDGALYRRHAGSGGETLRSEDVCDVRM